MQLITSTQNNLIKKIAKLCKSKKSRDFEGLVILDGIHLCEEYIKNFKQDFEYLFISSDFFNHVEFYKFKNQQNLIEISTNLMGKISPTNSPIGILGVVKKDILKNNNQKHKYSQEFVLLLDKVQDPGNLGTIIRTAASTGVTAIYTNKGCGDLWNPKVLRASMGGIFYLNIFENYDFFKFHENFNGKIIGTILSNETQNLYKYDLTGNLAIMVGNEGSGIATNLQQICDAKVLIPMTHKFESLNVAIATSICCFEKVRQENFK